MFFDVYFEFVEESNVCISTLYPVIITHVWKQKTVIIPCVWSVQTTYTLSLKSRERNVTQEFVGLFIEL